MHRTLTDNWTLPMTWRKSMNHNHKALQSLNEQAKYSHERLQLNRQTNLGSSTHITQIMNYRTWCNERNITKQLRTITMIEIRKSVKGQLLGVCSGKPRFTADDKWWQNWQREEEGKRSEERRKIRFRRCQIEVKRVSPIHSPPSPAGQTSWILAGIIQLFHGER